jgi:hypothetical protein
VAHDETRAEWPLRSMSKNAAQVGRTWTGGVEHGLRQHFTAAWRMSSE